MLAFLVAARLTQSSCSFYSSCLGAEGSIHYYPYINFTLFYLLISSEFFSLHYTPILYQLKFPKCRINKGFVIVMKINWLRDYIVIIWLKSVIFHDISGKWSAMGLFFNVKMVPWLENS